MFVPQPEACEIYYSCNGMIDRHNRCRKDDLMLEHKMRTSDWSMRVNRRLLDMMIVGALIVYKGYRNRSLRITQAEFDVQLSEEFILNDYDDGVGARRRFEAHESDVIQERIKQSGIGLHLKTTKNRWKNSTEKNQGNCRVCL